MMSVPLVDCGKNALSIQDALKTTARIGTYDELLDDTAPRIKAWVPAAAGGGRYESYYYIDEADDGDGNYVEGWSDGEGYLTDETLTPGTGVWFLGGTTDAASLSVAGAVPEQKDLTVVSEYATGYKMICNPFPYATKLNDLTWFKKDGVTPLPVATYDDLLDDTAPRIKVWIPNASGSGRYESYYYIDEADDGDGNYVEGWSDGEGYLQTEPVAQAGDGFWLVLTPETGSGVKYDGASVTFPSPLK